jgi:hypothetical protein
MNSLYCGILTSTLLNLLCHLVYFVFNIDRLITTEDDSKVSKNDSIKLDDFPTVKYNTDQLKERVIRIGLLVMKVYMF